MHVLDDSLETNDAAVRPETRSSLWWQRDFMHLWAGQTVSQLGSTITRDALPFTAILVLNATPVQLGLLGAARAVPVLLFGLVAGVWVDRLRRRPLMLAADFARMLVLLTVPLAFVWGVLRTEQLYLVAALVGLLSLVFDVAYGAFLPTLVRREHLLEGNSKLGVSSSLAEIAGPTLGGALVQFIGGPLTMLIDAISFGFSAVMLWRIRSPEPAPAPAAARPHVWRDIGAGLRTIWHDPFLRAMAGAAAISNFFGWFFGAVYGLYALEVLHLSTAMLGVVIASGGVGSLLGALLVERASRRFGVGPTIVVTWVITSASTWLIWLAGGMLPVAVPLMIAAQLVGDVAGAMATIGMLGVRQARTSDHMLGRVNASMQVLSEGIGALGLLTGGVLAEWIGLRPTVLVIACGLLLGSAWLVCSPLRRLRLVADGLETR